MCQPLGLDRVHNVLWWALHLSLIRNNQKYAKLCMTTQSVPFMQFVMFFGGLHASDGDSLAGDTTNPHRIPSAGTN